jgi:hypothetical protein
MKNGNCDATGEPLRKGDFLSLAHNAPFGLAPNQLRGVATGRFIAAHAWNGHRVLEETITILRGYATALVP